MKGHDDDRHLAHTDAESIAPRQLLERPAPRRKLRPCSKSERHAIAVKLEANLCENAEDNELDRAPFGRVEHGVARAGDDQRQQSLEKYIFPRADQAEQHGRTHRFCPKVVPCSAFSRDGRLP